MKEPLISFNSEAQVTDDEEEDNVSDDDDDNDLDAIGDQRGGRAGDQRCPEPRLLPGHQREPPHSPAHLHGHGQQDQPQLHVLAAVQDIVRLVQLRLLNLVSGPGNYVMF